MEKASFCNVIQFFTTLLQQIFSLVWYLFCPLILGIYIQREIFNTLTFSKKICAMHTQTLLTKNYLELLLVQKDNKNDLLWFLHSDLDHSVSALEHCSWDWEVEPTTIHSKHSHNHEGCQFLRVESSSHTLGPVEGVVYFYLHHICFFNVFNISRVLFQIRFKKYGK